MNECWCHFMGFHSTDGADLGLLCYYAEFPVTQPNNPEDKFWK